MALEGAQLEIEDDTGFHHSSVRRDEKGNIPATFYKEETEIRDLQGQERKNKYKGNYSLVSGSYCFVPGMLEP